MSLVQALLAIFLPPVSVFLERGLGVQLILNIVLCIVGLGVGGSIHAIYLLISDKA